MGIVPVSNQVVSRAQNLAQLTTMVTTGGDFFEPTLRLYANPLTPSRETTLADITTATFSGYAPKTTMGWLSPYTDVDGSAICYGESHSFVANAATVGNTIYGCYLTDAAGTGLLAIWAFADPVGIAAAGDGVTVDVPLRYSGT